jgi:hypothetical protein
VLFASDHQLRVLLVATACAVTGALATELGAVAYNAVHVARHVLGAAGIA